MFFSVLHVGTLLNQCRDYTSFDLFQVKCLQNQRSSPSLHCPERALSPVQFAREDSSMASNGTYGMFVDLAIALKHSCTYMDNDFMSVKMNFFLTILFIIL